MLHKAMKPLGIVLFILGAVYILLNLIPMHQVESHPFFNTGRPLVIAHQGGEHLHPSNTMIAFEHAEELGVDALETDIHVSADGYLIAIHDPTIDRTTNGTGAVYDYTLKELKTFDAGYYFEENGAYPFRGQNHQLVTIQELFERFPDMRFVIEIKETNPKHEIDYIIERLNYLIETYQMEDRVLIASFDQDIIERFKELSTNKVAFSGGKKEATKFVIFTKLFLKNLYNPNVHALQLPVFERGFDLTTQNLLAHAEDIGLELHYWTINDRETMKELIEKGADGIITDRPDLLIEVLKEMGY